jgi:rRNA maturation RNase YbeY
LKTILFHREDTAFVLRQKNLCRQWLENVVKEEKGRISNLNYIFCSDEYLLEINRQHLEHDYLTDVITFPYSEHPEPIESDIFISIDRCRDNAKEFGAKVNDEIHRVMVHGLLHLLGYDDKTEDEQNEMTLKEDYYLSLRPGKLK